MPGQGREVVVGLDNGGTAINATVLDGTGRFLVDRLVETPSRVGEGPAVAIEALSDAFTGVLGLTGVRREAVRAVGLDTPGPASADGVISTRGAVNFADPAWRGFDVRGALEARVGLPVIYSNDANAASLYAHHVHFGPEAARRSSVALIVGTGLGGGVVESGQVVRGASGMAGEFGHMQIPMEGLLEPGQPAPVCNCGLVADGESVASLTGIEKNLLPYWLTRYPGHGLHKAGSARQAAIQVRGHAAAAWAAVHHRGELHRPGRLLRWRRRGRDRAEFPRLVPGHRRRAHRPARGAASPGDIRAGAGPGHGRCPRRRPRRWRRARLVVPRAGVRTMTRSCRSGAAAPTPTAGAPAAGPACAWPRS
jgi:predicted NBD/HSP70 family sugar kinase